MKRRAFIQLIGASALGLPFLSGHSGSGQWKSKGAITGDLSKKPLHLALGTDETKVLAVLARRSAGVFLAGGCVLGKLVGTPSTYLNVLVDSAAFGAIKRDLFALGVVPVSTPELPGNFVRFGHAGKAYNVFCLGLEDFLKQNVIGSGIPLLPLAHNFLVYSVPGAWVIDPYGALAEDQRRGKTFRVKLVLEPESPVAGLECCLATALDTAALGLAWPLGYPALERRVLARTATEQDAPLIVHHIINYFPGLLEARGYELTRRFLNSPLCVSAAALGPTVDLRKACAALDAAQTRGQAITGARLLRAINQQFRDTGKICVFGTGIADYMAAKRLPIHRRDLLAEALGGGSETRV